MQALILAGGEGTRLRPLTVYTPKPVVPIVNRPILFYQIDLLKRAGIKDIKLTLGYEPTKIREIFGNGSELGIEINYIVEASTLGTAGAYKNALGDTDLTTIVINGDILTDIDLTKVLDYHRQKEAIATIVSAPVDNAAGYGIVEAGPDGRVRRFVEKPKPDELIHRTINAGIYILEKRILDMIPAGEKQFFEYDVFPHLIETGAPFFAYQWEGYWLDIGTPQRYLQANLDMLGGRVTNILIERPSIATAENGEEAARIDKRTVIDPSCTIKAGAEIVNSVLGANCYIEERAYIENSVLLPGSRIGKYSEVRQSLIGKSAILGRYVKVTDAVLGDKSSLTDYTVV
ncbi:MAG: NDP-sugar synthase [Acidobacteria bacterium]|nr:NDP-sugar synthase [Acidobacteriota bacterium]